MCPGLFCVQDYFVSRTILCPGCQAEFDSHTKTKVRKTRVRDKFTEEKDQKSVEENDLDSQIEELDETEDIKLCLLYTSPSPRDRTRSRMPSSA